MSALQTTSALPGPLNRGPAASLTRRLVRALALTTALVSAAAFGTVAMADTAAAPAPAATAPAAGSGASTAPAASAGSTAAPAADAGSSAEATKAPASDDGTPPAAVVSTLDHLSGGAVKVLKTFKAPGGLLGVAITEGPGHNGIVYMTPDGQYVIRGEILQADGTNVTQAEAAQYLPQPPSAAENFAALDKTHTYLWGKASAKKELWIVFDPNCIYCHKTYEDLKGFVQKGEVKVHIIQVGFLKPSSLGKAAAILAAKDPSAALDTDETKFDAANEEGGIKEDMSDAKAVDLVKQNNAWMQSQEIGGTPYLLFKDTEGTVQAIGGYDPDTAKLVANIGASGK